MRNYEQQDIFARTGQTFCLFANQQRVQHTKKKWLKGKGIKK